MENAQARTRSLRSLQSEQNLAKQLDPIDAALPTPPRSDRLGSPPSREALSRDLTPQPAVIAKRGQTKASKPAGLGQPPRSTSRRKPVMTFRQVWETNQQLVADELKRLEIQAERINQLLAKRAQTREDRSQAFSQLVATQNYQPTQFPSASPAPTISATGEPSTATDETATLQAQATRIHHLLTELQTAIAQAETTSNPQHPLVQDPIEPALPTQASTPLPTQFSPLPKESSPKDPSLAPELLTSVSHPPQRTEGLEAEPEAAKTAMALRYLAQRERTAPPDSTPLPTVRPQPTVGPLPTVEPLPRPQASQPCTASQTHTRTKPRKLRWQTLLQLPHKPLDRLGDALLWISMATVLRVSGRLLLAAVPALAPIVGLLMLTPAIVAVYLSLFKPKAGVLSIYRLFLITLGLLLGGRF